MTEQLNPNLTSKQKAVLFDAATEAPFSGRFYLSREKGAYICANCGNVLFDSEAKFHSGCGWPSFFQPASEGSVTLRPDHSHGMVRTEVRCGRCGGHLGHLFDDAPRTPSGLRYCINSLALDFKK